MEEVRKKWKRAFLIFVVVNIGLHFSQLDSASITIGRLAVGLLLPLVLWMVIFQMAYVRKGTKWLMFLLFNLLLALAVNPLSLFLNKLGLDYLPEFSYPMLFTALFSSLISVYLLYHSLELYKCNRRRKDSECPEKTRTLYKRWSFIFWVYLLSSAFFYLRSLWVGSVTSPVIFGSILFLPLLAYFGYRNRSVFLLALSNISLHALQFLLMLLMVTNPLYHSFLLIISIYYSVQCYRLMAHTKVNEGALQEV